MILGTDSIGVLNIGADNNTVYGAQSYTQTSSGTIKIRNSDVYSYLSNQTSSARLKITSVSGWGRVFTLPTTARIKISGLSNLGFVYTQNSTGRLKVRVNYTTSSIQSTTNPAKLKVNAQSLMSGYTFNIQGYEQAPVKLKINGTSIDYYLPYTTFTGGGSSVIPQIWIG
jgi:subtilisin family serine protease